MEYQDRSLTCQQCGQSFTFTAGEQEFYARKGFQDEPKRCKPCRDARKARAAGALPADDLGNNGHYAQSPSGFQPRREREMHEITCSRCGKAARVPFRPTAGRPVYCRECFTTQRAAQGA